MIWSLFGAVGSQTQAQFFDKGGDRTPEDPRGFRQPEFGTFLQDSDKILPNLTLSYGLRYQFNGVPYEVNNLLSTLFTNPSGSAPFTFTIAGDREHGLPPLYNNDWHDFEPRIGLAWDPFKQGKTSIRAGYGIFHDRVFGQLLGLTRGNPPQPNVVAQLEAFCVPTNPANSFPSGQCDQRTLQFDNLYFGAESGVLPFDAVNNNAFLHTAFFTGAASSIYHALQVNVTK